MPERVPPPRASPRHPGNGYDDRDEPDSGVHPATLRQVRKSNRWSRLWAVGAGVIGTGLSGGAYSLGITAIEDRARAVVDAGQVVHEQRILILETGQIRLERKVDALDDKMSRVLDVLDERLPKRRTRDAGQ